MKILHVDDSGFQRRLVKNILEEHFKGDEFVSLSDGEIVDLLDNSEDFSDIDMLMTDLLMEKIPGHTVIKYMKNINPACTITVLSSNVQATEKEMCFEEGADYFIEKPLNTEKILEFKEFLNDRV